MIKSIKYFIPCFIFAACLYSQTPQYYPGYPKVIDSVRGIYDKTCIPLIADLDIDGQKEIITVAIGFIPPYYMLYVIKSDGSNFPGFPISFNENIKDIASGDVNGDGFLNLAIRFKNSITVIDKLGNNLPGFPVTYIDDPNILRKFISLYDLDSDGKLEIIASIKGEYNVFNFNGAVRNGWPRRITGQSLNNPAIGDLDNDGFAEIVFTSYRQLEMGGGDSGSINIFKHNGERFSNDWPVYFDSSYITFGASPSIYISKNHLDSTFIIIPSYVNITSPGPSLNRLTKYNIYADVIERQYQVTYDGFGTLSIGDLNKDGLLEFSSGTQFGQYLTAFNSDLSVRIGWPNLGGGEFEATTVIGKLTSTSNSLNVGVNSWGAQNPNGFGYIYAYNLDGSQLNWSPLRPIGLVEAISLADLNNDGSVELIATSSQTGYEFYLHVWTIPGIPYTNENFPWPQCGHDRYRSNQYGFIPPDEPVGIQPVSSIVPDKFILHQNYPNPFNPVTNLEFGISKLGFVSLKVYNVLGIEVVTLVNDELSPGTYKIFFGGSSYPSGVYFYELVTEGYKETKRMILLK